MSGEYFEMLNDMKSPGRLFGDFRRSNGCRVLHWDCMYGKPVEWAGTFSVEVIHQGSPVDLSSNTWGSWVASERARQVLERLAPKSVQYFPISIPDDPKPYFVANITHLAACLDEKLSHVERWAPGNEIRPDLAGQVSTLLDLHIDPAKAAGENLFRLAEQTLHVLVSKRLKESLEEAGISGVKFQDATSPDIADFRKRFAERQRKRSAIRS